ncbi:hypothetical protein VCHA43P272_190070 [Vibrio chagasii]|nr:hypothetical protein VCHA28FP16_110124 [Vibrio chagasii]CAH7001038.1 hypothetical protein VCHA43P272_190070 [Vibrio chagasii]CAH7446275.1 hypothetical protein VCHA37P192_40404 [Vibrio chagasii]
MLVWVSNGIVFLHFYSEIILLITFLDTRLRYSVPNTNFNFQEIVAS